MVDQFPAGVWFVGLGAITDPDTVPREIASVLGVREREGQSALDAIVRELAVHRQPVLVLLDNCEHLADGCAEVVERLLASSPRLRFLCTSREPLHVSGEATWRLEPMGLPEPGAPESPAELLRSEAVRLFLDR